MFHVEHSGSLAGGGQGLVKIVAVANQKGGVGKTTTSVNLAAALAMAERRVLLVDLDPQGNATSGLGLDPRTLAQSSYDCLIQGVQAGQVIQSTGLAGLSLLPSNANLAGAEVELVSVTDREHALKTALAKMQDHYEMIFIDCPPALGLLTVNALTAATSVLVPVQCEYYAMEGLGRLMGTLRRIQDTVNPGLELEGIVLTMFDSRNSLARQVQEEIRGHFKEKVYRTVIPRNVTLAEAPSYGRPVMLYNAASVGAQAYLQLGKEFLNHGEEGAREGPGRSVA
jgi:chromosome partitioning protein